MATQPTSDQSTTDQILERPGDIERRLSAVEINLAVVKSNYATKEDIAKLHETIIAGDHSLELKMAQMETRLIKWFIATAITLAGVSGSLAFLAARFIH
ncbi:hypothetical protein [Duganella levis]|uniref:DUF1640 domain-containing protein n=1 Tax=Duganella levis TaxID=2692169 RepID=A0ABW9W7N3_9BURK|nr:hypothetical protein [Duganella levis]MYN29890.1 hypothetical protein [Duganella levis]